MKAAGEKKEPIHWKKLDLVIVLAAALLSLLPMLPPCLSGAHAATVRIEQHGIVLYEGRLSKDARIETEDGGNIIEIKDGAARMLHADCPDGLCLAAGEAGVLRPIVCLPNEVTVSIIREEEVGYDALTE